MTTWDFPCSEPVEVSIDSWASGSIVLSAEPTTEITVDVVPSHRRSDVEDLLAQVQVSFEDGQLLIQGPRAATFHRRQGLDLTIKVPANSSCAGKTASADLSCLGELSALGLQTASGDVTAAVVSGDVNIRSASGDVLLDRATGTVTVHTASGDVQANRIEGEARLNSASGDVAIGSITGSVNAHTASGDIELRAVASGRVELRTVSGDLRVAVVPGIGVYLDLASTSGSISNNLDAAGSDEGEEPTAAVEISCRSLSGDIRIGKARPAGAPSIG